MQARRTYGGLDLFKLAAAFLVVAIHTSPLTGFSAEADFFLTRVLARLAVPFFFMVTGQFVLTDYLEGDRAAAERVKAQLKKLALLYGVAILLYLPLGFYAGHYKGLTLGEAARMLLFDGTFYHLWYFPACMLGILLLCLLRRVMPVQGVAAVAAALYIVGLFGDSYYGLIAGLPGLSAAYDFGFRFFSYTRNGLFLAPVFLLLGALLGSQQARMRPLVSGAGLAVSFAVMTGEGFLLHSFQLQRHDSMYFALIPCACFLYELALCLRVKPLPRLRSVSTWIYVLHPLVIVLVRGGAKVLHAKRWLVDNSLIHSLAVCLLSLLLALAIARLLPKRDRQGSFPQGRAWIELDREALKRNVELLRARLPEGCALMPAVKANAYGHGAALMGRELNRMGVETFCVATLAEGVELRRCGIRGEILILGYTHPEQFGLLRRYHLTQTVVDYPYALQLNEFGRPLHVHIAVDTGMHRLGERSGHIEAICEMFEMKNLRIDGMFTHLCVSDAGTPDARAYTEQQARSFYRVAEELERRGYPRPRLHLQASYGLLNYPELAEDYARVGIALYGTMSTKEDTERAPLPLSPVLSLKARVAAVKELHVGEGTGYGLQFVAKEDRKMAVLAIGYADGIPRSLSGGVGFALIQGRRAPVLGRICMDQLTVDVTDIPGVRPGDTAVLIGRSGEEEITAGMVAEQAGTITNEILSRLGPRLERIVV